MRPQNCFYCDRPFNDLGERLVTDFQGRCYYAFVLECPKCGVVIFEDKEAAKLRVPVTEVQVHNRVLDDLIMSLKKLKKPI